MLRRRVGYLMALDLFSDWPAQELGFLARWMTELRLPRMVRFADGVVTVLSEALLEVQRLTYSVRNHVEPHTLHDALVTCTGRCAVQSWPTGWHNLLRRKRERRTSMRPPERVSGSATGIYCARTDCLPSP